MTRRPTTPPPGADPPSGVRQVYPPPWYLDLVHRRLRAATDGVAGAAPLLDALVATADRRAQYGRAGPRGDGGDGGGDGALFALGLELIGRAELDGLPLATRRYVLGLELEEVRAYLRGVAREVGPEGPVPVLVLEGEAGSASEAEAVVARAGHRVCRTTARADAAIAAAERMQPALIVADLPPAAGAEAGLAAVRAIRRERGEVAVVFVTTADAGQGVAELAWPALVVGKPFTAEELETALWRALFRSGRGAVAAAEIRS